MALSMDCGARAGRGVGDTRGVAIQMERPDQHCNQDADPIEPGNLFAGISAGCWPGAGFALLRDQSRNGCSDWDYPFANQRAVQALATDGYTSQPGAIYLCVGRSGPSAAAAV